MKIDVKTATELDIIIAYAAGELETLEDQPKLQEQYDRMDHCDNLIRHYGKKSKVVRMLVQRYDISKPTAYRLYRDTMEVFGSQNKAEKQYWQQWAAEHLKELILQAKKLGKHKEASALFKELRLTLGYSQEEIETPDWTLLQPVQVNLGFYPGETGVKLPDDWRAQVNKLLTTRSKQNIDILNIEDAQLVEEKDAKQ